jgi:penicillin-binding protein 1C
MLVFLKHNKVKVAFLLGILVLYYFCLPRTIFDSPYSIIVESREGELLAAKIASDGQWRFPMQDSVPFKFQQAILYFEDEYFQYHFGFNPIAMGKAVTQNLTTKKKVRGASTLTQQVIRLSRKNTQRTYFEKVIELVLATRLEFRYSKNDILRLYSAHAPFGGNIVGVEMASWRYFGLAPSQLSWSEAATLAVLPNAPALIYPGKNQDRLIDKEE